MINALQIGLSGLIASSSRLETAASNIVNAGNTRERFAGDVESLTGGSTYDPKRSVQTARPGGGVLSTIVEDPSGDISLAEEVVNLKLAETAYKANIAVIRTAAETQKRLIDEIAI